MSRADVCALYDKRGGRSCDTCHWFAPATEEMKKRFFPHAGTCEIRFPHEGFNAHLPGHERGKRLDSWCSFWVPNLATM